jgi:hypothetical protein
MEAYDDDMDFNIDQVQKLATQAVSQAIGSD